MSTQTPSSSSSEDMDLTDVFDLFQRWFYEFLAHIYRGIAFVFKNWWIFIILIAGGIALGYLTKDEPTHKASLILKTNFGSQSYVYNAIEQFNNNLGENDAVFMKSLGLDPEDPGVYDVTIEPVVDVVSLLDNIETSNRALEAVIDEIELENDEALFSTDHFYKNYNYHKLILEVSPSLGKESIEALLAFINDQPYMKDLSAEARKNYKDKVTQNEATIAQINKVVEVYATSAEIANKTSSTLSFYNNPTSLNMREIFLYKTELASENEKLKNEWIGFTNAAVIVSSIETSREVKFLDKKEILYPFLLVFVFCFLASIRYFYKLFKVKLQEKNLLD